MEDAKIRPIRIADLFYESIKNIFEYGVEQFGFLQALKYESLIYEEVDKLPLRYLAHPECRYLSTKDRRYRTIILPAHFILYRITATQIEILDIVSYRESISHIKRRRNIKL
ncbi:type II toxin-antitoxin system RelE/ParE family toxin [Parabacteroides sp. AM08-6]|uniref:type II toxin-antitoxin system RelE/ParE family toxin n=1 Tax=Parabacteroides sp. AM08-6 TaxID=2292053 RepID=UPI000EFE3D4A|nr:type II toxin-antitoxin system RelE/ParE family toxin [Parabacteroides sp. AM08-6]RHJ84882.1 type II toxin-antitoxin system RelE/ParE family toxin [Parabacteroides sp. AM08-6]